MRQALFHVRNGLLPPAVCRLVFEYVSLRRETNTLMNPDERVPGAPKLYADMLIETLLKQQLPVIEAIVGEPLWPSYTYLRVHSHGASMPIHTDREASEIGVTIAIGGDRVWPISFRRSERDVSVSLDEGDAVIYEGQLLQHWRDAYEGDIQVQAMLFYVRQQGRYADWKFDRRASLGLTSRGLLPGQQAAVPVGEASGASAL